jgi:toxin ParE1/3/4
MKVIWTDDSLLDLEEINKYIKLDSQFHADELSIRILNFVNLHILTFPEMGRVGRIDNTREFVISKTSYIVVYRIKGDDIQVLRVLHTARLWPSYF